MNNINAEFLEINNNIYLNADGISALLEVCFKEIEKTTNLTKEEKIHWVCGLEYFKENLNHKIGKFATEIELDELGLGDGKTSNVSLIIKK